MRQAHESGDRMKTLALFLAALPLYAAVTGTVTNRTTGKPQARATVGLYKLGTQTVQATAPAGAPIGAPVTKTSKPDVWSVDFPVKPGDTRFDISYTVPYTEGAAFAGKVVTKDENTYLIVPSGITMKGEGLNDL